MRYIVEVIGYVDTTHGIIVGLPDVPESAPLVAKEKGL